MAKSKGQENLVSLADRTTEEQREIARKGGIASAKARRERKTLKEELLLMLENEEVQKNISTALLNRAMAYDNMGNKAFEVIRDTIGEKPKEEIEISKSTDETIREIEKYLSGKKEVDTDE